MPLVYLGGVVSRQGVEQLMEEVWSGTYVEDGNINFTVSCVRKALREAKGDDTEFVRTIPRVGYRFVPEVPDSDSSRLPERSLPVQTSRLSKRKAFALFAFVSLFLFTSFGVWWQLDRGVGISPVPLSERNFETMAVLPPMALDQKVSDNLTGLAVADSIAAELGRLNFIAVSPVTSSREFGTTGENEIEFARPPVQCNDIHVDPDGTLERGRGKKV